MIIAAERKRKNIGQIFKPTVPNRFPYHGPHNRSGFFTCSAKKCDTCAHSSTLTSFRSPWDNRLWKIKENLTCHTPNVVYVLQCQMHPEKWYVGSTKNLKLRWANHKSDAKLRKIKKCAVAKHVAEMKHPEDPQFKYLSIHPIEAVKKEDRLLERETYWQANLGTIFNGLNQRTDIIHSLQKNEIRTQYEIWRNWFSCTIAREYMYLSAWVWVCICVCVLCVCESVCTCVYVHKERERECVYST